MRVVDLRFCVVDRGSISYREVGFEELYGLWKSGEGDGLEVVGGVSDAESLCELLVRLNDERWVGFWFEGNRWCGWVRCRADWLEVRKSYGDWSLDELLGARRIGGSDKLVFGVRAEHTGECLREFFVRCGVSWGCE